LLLFTLVAAASDQSPPSDDARTGARPQEQFHRETLDQPPAPARPAVARPPRGGGFRSFQSVQVNVDENGDNIVDDAANEPSIAVDPTNPNRMAIGWRQFDSVNSNFRQGGWAYTRDGGRHWTFPGVLEKNVFRSDPVLDADLNGVFYYNSLKSDFLCDVFTSTDGGETWPDKAAAYGGDKQWMVIDKTDGSGSGFIYCIWSVEYSCCERNIFTRSVDGGATFQSPVVVSRSPRWGTLAIGPDGEVYAAGRTRDYDEFVVSRSTNANDKNATPKFDTGVGVDLDGWIIYGGYPNPGGLCGQVWVATDVSEGESRGNVYVLCSVSPNYSDPTDVHFSRSTDGGKTWSDPVRVNDVADGWQWFGTMSVAPNGRIDVVWNDTRDDADPDEPDTSALYYAYSLDAGETWTESIQVGPSWDHHEGWPQQQKIGDYYQSISDDVGVNVAYAATYNDEQDVYYLRIGDYDCNQNGVGDETDLSDGASTDFNQNGIPDECDGLGDMNCDGSVDFDDIDPFVLTLTDPESYEAAYPDCDILRGDIDGSGSVDFDDIDPFVELLTG
jgi:hypothetical protein